MSADDMTFLDTLSSVPNDIRKYSNDVADYVDRHLERAANSLRETLSSAPWLPESARPRPLPQPPKSFMTNTISSSTTYTRVGDWVSRNKILTSVIVLTLGGITYHVIRRNTGSRKKRRAKKAANGARLEVVVIAGSPAEPLVRSIALDLERRGFIVYIVCNSIEEEVMVHNEGRQDVKALMLDIVDPESTEASIQRFTQHLQQAHAAFPGARSHHLNLRSFLLIPTLSYPSSPLATLSPSTLNDLLNTRLLTPILQTQAFLPLLTSPPTHHSAHQSPQPTPSVVLLTPSIIPSLSPAFHAPESVLVSALSSFASVLRAELSPIQIPVSQLLLGIFDTSSLTPHAHLPTPASQRAETLKWSPAVRHLYGRNFVSATSLGLGHGRAGFGRGSTLRELNDRVFDVMVRGRGGTEYVGVGAGTYGWVGKWMPKWLVEWIVGLRQSREANRPVMQSGRIGLLENGESEDGDGSRSVSPGMGDSYVYPDYEN